MSLSIEHLARVLPRDRTAAHLRFCFARQALARALRDWVAAGGDGSDLQEEIDGTVSLICGLAAVDGDSGQ